MHTKFVKKLNFYQYSIILIVLDYNKIGVLWALTSKNTVIFPMR